MKGNKHFHKQLIDDMDIAQGNQNESDHVRVLEEATEETQKFAEKLIENIGNVIAIIGADGLTKYQSSNVEKWFGWKPEDLIGTSGWDRMHPEDIKRMQKEYMNVLENENASTVEYRYKCKDGNYKWIELTAVNCINDRAINGVLLNYHDISERRQGEEALQKSEQKARNQAKFLDLVMENSPFAMQILDVKGVLIRTNQALRNILNLTDEKIVGKYNVLHDENIDDQKLMPAVEAVFNNSKSARFIMFWTGTKIGDVDLSKANELWIDVSMFPITDETGKLVNVVCQYVDITNQIESQKELIESEKKLREAQEMAHLGFWSQNVKSGEVVWSEEVFKILGLDPETFKPQIDSILALSWWPDGNGQSRLEEITNQIAESHTPGHYEQKFLRPDKSIGCYNATFQGKYDEDGELVLIVGTVLDISEQKKSEEALLKSEEKYRSLIENIEEIIYFTDISGKIIHISPQVSRYGYTANDLLSMGSFADIIFSDDIARVVSEYKDAITTGEVRPSEYRILDYWGKVHWVETRSRIVRDALGNIIGNTGVLRDIEERKQAENTLYETNARHAAMIENIGDVIAIVGADGIAKYQSSNIERWFGWSLGDLIGKNVFEWIHREDVESIVKEFNEILEKENTTTVEFRFRCKDGSYKWIEVTAANRISEPAINGVLLNYHDISGRKKMEEEKLAILAQLQQVQKLESIGTLASGVAHEISNPLMGMINYADIIQDKIDDAELKKYAVSIMEEGKRIGEIVQNLLSFSRQDKQSHSYARIADIINDSLSLTAAVLRKHQITLIKDIPEDLPSIKCRSQQIEQVILNLLTNATFALNLKYHGYDDNKIIKIIAKPIIKDNVHLLRTTVEDHGIGIGDDILEHIFDPFFTTKGRTYGTGLGLSISYGIVNEHRGILSVETKMGEFTRFYMDLRVDDS